MPTKDLSPTRLRPALELVAERLGAKHRKLAAVADAAERHLFLWLFGTYPDAELAFATLPHPPPPPIPPDIDVVLLGDGSRVLWLCGRRQVGRWWTRGCCAGD